MKTLATFGGLLLAACQMIAQAASPPVEAYGHLPSITDVKISPSGENLAFVATSGRDERRLIIDKVSGEALFIAPIGDNKVRDIVWVDDDHVLLMITHTYGAPYDFSQSYEFLSVVSVRLKDKTTKVIFRNGRSMMEQVFGYYGHARVDGHLLGYFGGVTLERHTNGINYVLGDGHTDLYQVDLDSDDVSMVSKGDVNINRWVVTDGAVTAHSEYDERSGTWRLFKGKGRGQLLMERNAPLGQMSLLGPGREGTTVLVSDHSGETDTLIELSDEGTPPHELAADEQLSQILRDPETNRLLGFITGGPSGTTTEIFDPALKAKYETAFRTFRGKHLWLASWSRGFDRLIVKAEGNREAGTYYIVNLTTKKADIIGSDYPEIASDNVGTTELIRYKAADGLEIEGALTLPPGRPAKDLPLVMLPHGGPIGVADTLGFDWWAQAFANEGYAVFQPNYRGSGGYGRAFRDAGFGEWGRKMQTDLSDSFPELEKHGIDTHKVCIVGGSYGGYAALAGVTLQQGIYRCAVSVAGISDLRAFLLWSYEHNGGQGEATRYWRSVTGAQQDPSILRTISPIEAIAKMDAPVLLIHGKDDTVVPFQQSITMASAMKRAGKSVELITMPGEDHWLSREATRIQMLKATVAFVKKNNPT